MQALRIVLFAFGGVAELKAEPQRSGPEFRLAIAGPAVSLPLFLGFGILVGWFFAHFLMASVIFELLSGQTGAALRQLLIGLFPLQAASGVLGAGAAQGGALRVADSGPNDLRARVGPHPHPQCLRPPASPCPMVF